MFYVYLDGARLYALCGYIEKYNKLMDIQNMYYIYICVYMTYGYLQDLFKENC